MKSVAVCFEKLLEYICGLSGHGQKEPGNKRQDILDKRPEDVGEVRREILQDRNPEAWKENDERWKEKRSKPAKNP